MSTTQFVGADKAKISGLVHSGIDTLREIATLQEGLKDSVATVAEELDIDKALINKAIKAAYRKQAKNQNVIEDAQDELDTVEGILAAAGL
jgi:hypothetical protein